MIAIQLCCRSLSIHSHHLHSLPAGPFSSFRFSLSSLSRVVTKKSAQNANRENPVLLNYLINTLDFPKSKALAVSNRYPWVKNVEKAESVVDFFKSIGFTDAQIQSAVRNVPQILLADVEKTLKPKIQLCESVVDFFKSIGFTDAQIQSAVRNVPQILLADVEKTLKPKIQLLQELGITGSDLGRLISTKAIILTRSVEKILKPCIEVLDKVLINGTDNGDWFRVLRRCDWVVHKSPHLRLIPNISYLESIGIVGSQLSSLLKRQPHLFALPESELKKLVAKLIDIGFSTDSRMLVHGLHTLGCISHESFSRKLLLLQSSGFSINECMEMFRRAPSLFRSSEEKIRLGLVFFLETMKLKKSTLVQHPTLLMFSMEDRVIPRYEVIQLIKSKKLAKKEPSFYYVMCLSEHVFLEKYILRFTENAEELLMAYKGHILDLGED